jgi:hypothetical protein
VTTERANAIYDLTDASVVAMLDAAVPYARGHRPSPRAFVHIIAYIGGRDRPRKRDGATCCDDTYDQIAAATRYSRATVVDVVAAATRLGVVVTVARGGHKTATKRTIDLVRLGDLVASITQLAPTASGEQHASAADLVARCGDLVASNRHPLQDIQDGDAAARHGAASPRTKTTAGQP